MTDLQEEVQEQDHILGPKSGEVTLVEYGDYECPDCRAAYYSLKKVISQMGDFLTCVFRNFPLTEIHPFAMNGAKAAEAAGNQGKFWEMHDMLFENQEHLTYHDLITYAQHLQLNIEQFEHDFHSDKIESHIQDDIKSGLQSGVEGTPTFFINGELYEGMYDAQHLISAFESAQGDNTTPHDAIINTAQNHAEDYSRDDPDAYQIDVMPLDNEKGYEKDDEGILEKPLLPGMTLDEYEPSTEDEDFSDPEPS